MKYEIILQPLIYRQVDITIRLVYTALCNQEIPMSELEIRKILYNSFWGGVVLASLAIGLSV